MRNIVIFILLGLLLQPPSLAAKALPQDTHAAVVLTYYRVGEDSYPDSNIRTEQFLAHLKEIEDGDYTVLPLTEILAMMKAEQTVPPRTLAITFESAYQSAYRNAMQRLLHKGIPFTVFYSSGDLDSESDQHITWDQLKSLAAYNHVDIGLQPGSYTHLVHSPPAEIRRLVNNALQRYRENVGGKAPKMFSYPFGEYSAALKTILKDSGFAAAFGVHSGVITPQSDLYALPRFSMTERYGNLERFKLVTHALPLPVSDIEPQDPLIETEKPVIGFSVSERLTADLPAISCFIQGQKAPQVQTIGNRVEIRLSDPLTEERVRVNCTLRADMPNTADDDEETEQWRWFSMMLTRKTAPPAEKRAESSNPRPAVLQ